MQFTSDLMKAVMRLMSVSHLQSSPYYAQTNGLVECFNTLKNKLKKLITDKSWDLDRYLSAALFAHREIPQESMWFAHFELLYWRTLKGPSQVLQELWTGKSDTTNIQTTYQYVVDLKSTLSDMVKLAQTAVQKAKKRHKFLWPEVTDEGAEGRRWSVGVVAYRS